MTITALRTNFTNRKWIWLCAMLLSVSSIIWMLSGVRASDSTNRDQTASVGNYVWEDTNVDGVQGFQPAENPITGVVVSLYHASGLLADMTITDSDGAYSFQYVVPGDYYLGFTAPTMMVATVMNQGDDSNVDSDIDPITGLTSVFTLEAGEDNQSIDVGFTHAASVSSWVWNDQNVDGVRDEQNESGVPATVITLYDESDQVVQIVPTDVDGYFTFPSITPGKYRLGVAPPPGMTVAANTILRGSAAERVINPATGRSNIFEVYVGPNILDWGVGLISILAPTSLDTVDEPSQPLQIESRLFLPIASFPTTINTPQLADSPFSTF